MKIQSSLFQVHNRKRLTWKLILCGFKHCVLLNFKASSAETWIFHGLEFVFLNLRSIGFLSIPYSSIKRQSMKIQSSLFQVHNRKRLTWKLILCGFEHCVLLNFKASAAETGIFHGLKIVFLESTVRRLSVDSLLVYQKTVHEDTKQFISSA